MAVDTETPNPPRDVEKPDWYDDAFEAYSSNRRAESVGKEADTARDILEAEGIPCFLEFYEDAPECFHAAATHGIDRVNSA